MNDSTDASTLKTTNCPFKVGDRIREKGITSYFCDTPGGPPMSPVHVGPPSANHATVVEFTERGFKYEYDKPIPIGRAAWGTTTTGGEVFGDLGFDQWELVPSECCDGGCQCQS